MELLQLTERNLLMKNNKQKKVSQETFSIDNYQKLYTKIHSKKKIIHKKPP